MLLIPVFPSGKGVASPPMRTTSLGAYPSNAKAPVFPPGLSCFKRERRVALFLGCDFFAGFLINDFHRQANLAAIIKPKQFDFHFLAFFQNV